MFSPNLKFSMEISNNLNTISVLTNVYIFLTTDYTLVKGVFISTARLLHIKFYSCSQRKRIAKANGIIMFHWRKCQIAPSITINSYSKWPLISEPLPISLPTYIGQSHYNVEPVLYPQLQVNSLIWFHIRIQSLVDCHSAHVPWWWLNSVGLFTPGYVWAGIDFSKWGIYLLVSVNTWCEYILYEWSSAYELTVYIVSSFPRCWLKYFLSKPAEWF